MKSSKSRAFEVWIDRVWKLRLPLVIIATISVCLGCRSIKPAANPETESSTNNPTPAWSSVRIEPAPCRPVIPTRDKFNPIWWFRNVDEPEPGASYKPDDKWRVLKWHLRNPLHNFTFYVIGVADKEIVRSGRYPKDAFSPRGGWNIAATRSKCLYLPFISYCRGQKGFHFYCGWRANGNFGFKFNFE